MEAKPRYLRGLQMNAQQPVARNESPRKPAVASTNGVSAQPGVIYAASANANYRALRKVWPLACRRLEEFPNINTAQLFEELCLQFPGNLLNDNIAL